MTSKVISLVVAIIVFACVLVPVVGSMADGGGNSAIYNSGLNYTKADSGNHTLNVEIVENDFVVTIDEQIVDIGMEYDPNVGEGDIEYPTVPLAFGYGEVGVAENTSGTYFTILSLAQNGFLSYILFDESMSSGTGSETKTITISDGVGNWGDFRFAVEYYIVPEGKYVMTANAKILDDTEIMMAYTDSDGLIIDYGYGDEVWTHPSIYGRGTIATLDSTVETNLTDSLSADGVLSDYAVSHTVTTQNDYSILNNVSITFTADMEDDDGNPMEVTRTINADTFLVPKIISEGSGGDSGSDVTSTLIQIIPVFVALGLILAIAGMFYNSKMN